MAFIKKLSMVVADNFMKKIKQFTIFTKKKVHLHYANTPFCTIF